MFCCGFTVKRFLRCTEKSQVGAGNQWELQSDTLAYDNRAAAAQNGHSAAHVCINNLIFFGE